MSNTNEPNKYINRKSQMLSEEEKSRSTLLFNSLMETLKTEKAIRLAKRKPPIPLAFGVKIWDENFNHLKSEEKAKYEQTRDNLIKEMIGSIIEMNHQQNLADFQMNKDGFNELVYEKSKPAFIAVYNNFKNSLTDVQSFATALIKTFHHEFGFQKETIWAMKPYLSRFMTDVENTILSPPEVPPHLHPMKIEVFRKFAPEQQARHKQIADELVKEMIQEIAKENWNHKPIK